MFVVKEHEDRPILDYATAPEKGNADVLASMRSWQLIAALTVGISVVLIPISPVAAAIALLAAGAFGVITLLYMTRAAARSFGRVYALSHLFLALLLMPVFLVGFLLIPSLVQSDIDRQRDLGGGEA